MLLVFMLYILSRLSIIRCVSKFKQLFLTGELWWRFFLNNAETIRPIVVESLLKILACGDSCMGYAQYCCPNPECTHWKRIMFSCKCRFCPTCGKKATDQWISKQMNILPNTIWQHITFTMPGELWDIFELNRHLLKHLSPYAANTVTQIAGKKGILTGMFSALHTFGRDLKWNTHVHLSITLGGLIQGDRWKKITFSYNQLMPLWRYAVIQLLKDNFHDLKLPENIERICPDKEYWLRWLDKHYQKNWMVHFSNPDSTHYRNVKYIGSYVKRPPLAMSRLKHYNGHEVAYEYFDHTTKTKKTMTLEGEEFVERFVKHIPEKHFRMINYYGFLANRVRTEKLKIVYQLLGQEDKESKPISYRALLIKTFGTDPLECILCGTKMILTRIAIELNLAGLSKHHRELALSKIFDVSYAG